MHASTHALTTAAGRSNNRYMFYILARRGEICTCVQSTKLTYVCEKSTVEYCCGSLPSPRDACEDCRHRQCSHDKPAEHRKHQRHPRMRTATPLQQARREKVGRRDAAESTAVTASGRQISNTNDCSSSGVGGVGRDESKENAKPRAARLRMRLQIRRVLRIQ